MCLQTVLECATNDNDVKLKGFSLSTYDLTLKNKVML